MTLSLVEIDRPRLELLPTRAMLSPLRGGHDDSGASGVGY